MKVLGPKRQELIDEKYEDIEKLNKSNQEDERIAEDENEDRAIRERARERITERNQQISDLENERDALEERLPLRERVKNIFKIYGFTVT